MRRRAIRSASVVLAVVGSAIVPIAAPGSAGALPAAFTLSLSGPTRAQPTVSVAYTGRLSSTGSPAPQPGIPGQTIELRVDGSKVGTDSTSVDGTYSISTSFSILGPHTVQAVALFGPLVIATSPTLAVEIGFSMTVAKAGTGSGHVISDPAGIDCGADCRKYYEGGTVSLSETADFGSRFSGWTGDCSGTGACNVSMSADRAVTATFVRILPIFGSGNDGDFNGGDPNTVRTALGSSAPAGQQVLAVDNSSGFRQGDEVFVWQARGSGAGTNEYARVAGVGPSVLTLGAPLAHTYTQDGESRTQVLRVPQFANVTGSLAPHEWDGSTGGIVVFRAFSLQGAVIDASTAGFKGGYSNDKRVDADPCTGYSNGQGQQGESYPGFGGCATPANGGGGGAGGARPGADFGSGGGGGYGSAGAEGAGPTHGAPGGTYGASDLSTVYLGSGGGGGDWGTNPYGGGRMTIQGDDYVGQAGGAIVISVDSISSSALRANGNKGGDSSGTYGGYAGGGGSGGSIHVVAATGSLSTQSIGGPGGTGTRGSGGNGGVGRVRLEYCESLLAASDPPASIAKVSC